MQSRAQIVGQIVDYLEFQRECGVRTLELEPETLTALKQLSGGPQGAVRGAAGLPAAADGANVTAAEKLRRIAAAAAACRRCGLYKGRKRVVPGQGRIDNPDVMFIGEAPGADEDREGVAFIGRAGQLLTKMIAAMGYTRDEVFIANICKCRPPGNRTPTQDEMRVCLPFLQEQIAIVRPRVIVAMGNTAILGLLGSSGITRLRGKWTVFEGIPLMPTYHPAYLLRFPALKRDAWEDLKKVLHRLDRVVPPVRPKPRETA